MYIEKLHEKNDFLKIDRTSNNSYIVELISKNKLFLKIGVYIYLLISIFLSSVLILAFFKKLEVYDGATIPYWFVLIFLFFEWIPLLLFIWFFLSKKVFIFKSTKFEIRKKCLVIVKKIAIIDKNDIKKIMIISQSHDLSNFTLKIKTDHDEYSVLWLAPYQQCQWLGTAIASWANVPVEQ